VCSTTPVALSDVRRASRGDHRADPADLVETPTTAAVDRRQSPQSPNLRGRDAKDGRSAGGQHFASPALQLTVDAGRDIVLHSTTINRGHSMWWARAWSPTTKSWTRIASCRTGPAALAQGPFRCLPDHARLKTLVCGCSGTAKRAAVGSLLGHTSVGRRAVSGLPPIPVTRSPRDSARFRRHGVGTGEGRTKRGAGVGAKPKVFISTESLGGGVDDRASRCDDP